MNIGIVVLANNAAAYLDRLLMSIHNQTYANWYLKIIDIDSTDSIEPIVSALRHKPTYGKWYGTRNCDIFKDKVDLYQIKGNDKEFLETVDDILKPTPVMLHMITFIPANWKLNSNVLSLIAEHPELNSTSKTLLVNMGPYGLDGSMRPLYFFKRDQLFKGDGHPIPLVLRKNYFDEYEAIMTDEIVGLNFGRSCYGIAFKKSQS